MTLPKIKKLINPSSAEKPNGLKTKKRTLEELELPDDDELSDEDYEDDGDEDDEQEEEDDDEVESEQDKPEKPKKPKASKKCVLETGTSWAVTPSGKHDLWRQDLALYLRSIGDDPYTASSAALQKILAEMFSVDAVRRAAAFASSLVENADLMAGAQIHNISTKQ